MPFFDTLLPLCGRERHCRLFDALFDSTDFPVLSVKPLLWDLVLLFFFSFLYFIVELVGRSTVFSSQDF